MAQIEEQKVYKKEKSLNPSDLILSLVIRLDFEPFGSFLALSVSFPRLYALS